MYVASQDHVHWAEIVAGATAGDESIARLFDPGVTAAKRFERLTDRISIASGKVYFDGDHVDNSITDQILNFLEEDEDFMPLVNFMDKLYQNPEADSRENLYRWIRARESIVITPDGDMIAYKGLVSDQDENGTFYKSWHSGTAIVNGEVHENQQIPQRIGDTVEMPRSEVEFNPSIGCSTGLHAGTHSYAGGYGNAKVRVAINPRDVVSVPNYEEQKIRVCRYVVIDVADAEVDTKPVYSDYLPKPEDVTDIVIPALQLGLEVGTFDIDEADDEDDESCDYCGMTYCDGECEDYDDDEDDYDCGVPGCDYCN